MSAPFAGPTWGQPLTERDYERLAARWITKELAELAGILRVNDNDGRFMFHRRVDTWRPDSSPREYRLRLDNPPRVTKEDGSTKDGQKYVQAPGSASYAYIARGAMERVGVDVPIIITEGEFKTIAL